MSERNTIRTEILPAIFSAGWDSKTQISEDYPINAGRVYDDGSGNIRRGKILRADIVLFYKKNIPLAVVEAKRHSKSSGTGIQQAINYMNKLKLNFSFSTNGKEFIFYNKKTGKEKIISMNKFPSPEQLFNLETNKFSPKTRRNITTNYFESQSTKDPRFYQKIAINKTVQNFSEGRKRGLIVMGTGTGKTYTAFQIIHRMKSSGLAKRVLYLADRNILVDQSIQGDFRPMKKLIHKISKRKPEKAYEIYFSLYQQLTSQDIENQLFKKYSKNFFDLIIVDECHRGSAKDNSKWREILDHFSSGYHLGMTATPKETEDISNANYFGKPIYTYPLKEGISDGYLAPFKIIKYNIDKDIEGYKPNQKEREKYGRKFPDKTFTQSDYDRIIILPKRTKLVAKKITEFLKKTNRFDKTIIFCVDIEHAERMRQELINLNSDLVSKNSNYVVKITGDDKIGKAELENFINPNEKFPVIAVTSKLLTTGVNTKDTKNIVIDANIASPIEFKQIIGRGTRIVESVGKYSFNILDFRGSTNHFLEKDFDGIPDSIYDATKKFNKKDLKARYSKKDLMGSVSLSDFDENELKLKYTVVNGQKIKLLNKQIQYTDASGDIITEDLKDYTSRKLNKKYRSMKKFIELWTYAEKKDKIIKELDELGIPLEALRETVGTIYDPFDLLLHVGYGKKLVTRKSRARKAKRADVFKKYGPDARKVIAVLLDKYSNDGISAIESKAILRLEPLRSMGRPLEIVTKFGGKEKYEQAIKLIEREIYS
jgi:type I restriction enzyme, R subunit